MKDDNDNMFYNKANLENGGPSKKPHTCMYIYIVTLIT